MNQRKNTFYFVHFFLLLFHVNSHRDWLRQWPRPPLHSLLLFGFRSLSVILLFIWVCLKIGYIPNYSHLKGIMISKTIGFRATQHFQTNPFGAAEAVIWALSPPVASSTIVLTANPAGPADQPSSSMPPLHWCFIVLISKSMQSRKIIRSILRPNADKSMLYFCFYPEVS